MSKEIGKHLRVSIDFENFRERLKQFETETSASACIVTAAHRVLPSFDSTICRVSQYNDGNYFFIHDKFLSHV